VADTETSGRRSTASGLSPSGCSHLCAALGNGGRSASLPCGAPASAQAANVSISWAVNRASLRNFTLCSASAGHGGIARVRTACLMDFAQGLAASYDTSETAAPNSPSR